MRREVLGPHDLNAWNSVPVFKALQANCRSSDHEIMIISRVVTCFIAVYCCLRCNHNWLFLSCSIFFILGKQVSIRSLVLKYVSAQYSSSNPHILLLKITRSVKRTNFLFKLCFYFALSSVEHCVNSCLSRAPWRMVRYDVSHATSGKRIRTRDCSRESQWSCIFVRLDQRKAFALIFLYF